MWRSKQQLWVAGAIQTSMATLLIAIVWLAPVPSVAQEQPQTNPDTEVPARPSSPAFISPSGVHRFKMHHDTPAEREVFLKKRADGQKLKVPSAVPPLPQQAISPQPLQNRH